MNTLNPTRRAARSRGIFDMEAAMTTSPEGLNHRLATFEDEQGNHRTVYLTVNRGTEPVLGISLGRGNTWDGVPLRRFMEAAAKGLGVTVIRPQSANKPGMSFRASATVAIAALAQLRLGAAFGRFEVQWVPNQVGGDE